MLPSAEHFDMDLYILFYFIWNTIQEKGIELEWEQQQEWEQKQDYVDQSLVLLLTYTIKFV